MRFTKIHAMVFIAILVGATVVIWVVMIPLSNPCMVLDKPSVLRLVRDFYQTRKTSDGYVDPSANEGDIKAGFQKILEWMNTAQATFDVKNDQRLVEASTKLETVGYELTDFYDCTYYRRFLVAREKSPQNNGWGMYLFYPSSHMDGSMDRLEGTHRDLLIEVPHMGNCSNCDEHTEEVGAESYMHSRAGFLLIAGAERTVFDVANPPTTNDERKLSFFQLVHETLVTSASTVIQIHGFNENGAGREDWPLVIISAGTTSGSTSATNIANTLRTNGFPDDGLCTSRDSTPHAIRCVNVWTGQYHDGCCGGTGNAQWNYIKEKHDIDDSFDASWIHMEIAHVVREPVVWCMRIFRWYMCGSTIAAYSHPNLADLADGIGEFAERWIPVASELQYPVPVLAVPMMSSLSLRPGIRCQKETS